MQTAVARISIFRGRLESYVLLIPAVLLLLAGVEVFITGRYYEVPDLHRHLINNVLFFNYTHILLTYFMILTMPRMQNWASVGDNGKPRYFWLKTAGLFVLIFASFLLLLLNVSPMTTKVITLLPLVVATQHVLWQMRGLSLCYNQQIRNSASEAICSRRVRRSEVLERTGFYIFLVAVLALQLHEESSHLAWITKVIWAAVVLGALLIFAGALNFPMVWRSNKVAFLMRIILFPLRSFSFFAASAVSICHGVEYLCVFDRISHNSFSERKKIGIVLLTGCLLMIVLGGLYALVFTINDQLLQANQPIPLWMTLTQATFSALAFLHYYLDRILFRMRDPHTRSHIAPLLRA